MRINTYLFKRLWNFIARTHDVADMQPGCDLHIHCARAICGWAVVVIRTQSGITHLLHALAEFVIAAAGDCPDVVSRVAAQGCGVHSKCNRDRIIYREMKLRCCRPCSPSGGKLQMEFAIGRILLFIRKGHMQRKGLFSQRDDSGGSTEADGNLRQNDERLIHRARSMLPVHGLHYLPHTHWNTVITELGPPFDRVRSKGAVEPALVVDVVVGLLDGRPAEIGARY